MWLICKVTKDVIFQHIVSNHHHELYIYVSMRMTIVRKNLIMEIENVRPIRIQHIRVVIKQFLHYFFCSGAAFGRGIYFSTNASFSARCAVADAAGDRRMYVARVAIGQFTTGDRSMLVPPRKYGRISFNSVVDNIQNPSIYVMFYDNQYYPVLPHYIWMNNGAWATAPVDTVSPFDCISIMLWRNTSVVRAMLTLIAAIALKCLLTLSNRFLALQTQIHAWHVELTKLK